MESDNLVKKAKRKECLYLKANCISKWLFWWMNELMLKGMKRGLNSHDIFDIIHEMKTEVTFSKFMERHKERNYTFLSIFKSLKYVVKSYWIYNLIFCFIGEGMNLGMTYIYYRLLRDFKEITTIINMEYYLLALIFCLNLISTLILNYSRFLGKLMGAKIKSSLIAVIYNKILTASQRHQKNGTNGHILCLLSRDLENITETACTFSYFVVSPVMATIVVILIGLEIGLIMTLIISGTLIAIVFYQGTFNLLAGTYNKNVSDWSDKRLSTMAEIFSFIRAIKINSLEKNFMQKIGIYRQAELYYEFGSGIIYTLSTAITASGRNLVLLPILCYLYLTKHIEMLGVAKFLYIALLVGSLEVHLFILFSDAIYRCANAHSSLERISKFLMGNDKPNDVVCCIDEKVNLTLVKAQEICTSWDEKQTDKMLKDVYFELSRGELLGIVGVIGSGKSTLLQVVLGEERIRSGKMIVNGKLSFSPQEPWIFHDTIRENVVFGENFDLNKLNKVYEASGLVQDFETMPLQDQTVVGEKGLKLSGGQRSRISLARCLYRDADVYLIDDPFSALDAKISRLVFEKALKVYLKSKSVLLVTHQQNILKEVDKVLTLNNGRVENYDEIQQIQSLPNTDRVESQQFEVEDSLEEGESYFEGTGEGTANWKVHWFYIKKGSPLMIFIAFALFVASFLLNLLGELNMSNAIEIHYGNVKSFRQALLFFVVTVSFATLVAFSSELFLLVFTIKSSKNIHNEMLVKVMKAKMTFFDTHRVAVILNRFSKDLLFVDQVMIVAFSTFITLLLHVFFGMAFTTYVYPYLAICYVICIVVNYILFRKASNPIFRLKRLELSSSAPLLSHINDTLTGISVIRCHNMTERFWEKLKKLTDENNRIDMALFSSYFWLRSISSTFTLLMILVFTMIMLRTTNLSVTLLGLVVQYILGISKPLQVLFQKFIEMEDAFASVERILDYMHIEGEKENFSLMPDDEYWPRTGSIHFKNVCLRYTDCEEYALKNLNFKCDSGQKVGIVGRTGAGKSSIVSALLRLHEPSGEIYIDNVNLLLIPLQLARSAISIIPQDSFIYNGTIRSNLDPFNMHSDQEIWDSLQKVGMATKVKSYTDQLYTRTTDCGSNFSVGEKQIMALARAFLKKSCVLVMDEATANVDNKTDQHIQNIVRKHFANCTVITIAHRLATIMDYDVILVIECGRLVESGTSIELIKSGGIFAELVKNQQHQQIY
ncbi:DgyrCDS1986 [Dimorphilus gyrociliatus]|uniref:DgyrCDS1986 n=1 Tax=Dimorphilus gyrociliatus TaxID=2664684 RepID=A0A7I8V8Y7_9ANNE|nr:DgyrCDS1986 [Dimorphilus gyrociliatus]